MLRHSRKINSPTLANFKLPLIKNEKMFDYAPGSKEAIALKSALLKMKAEMPFHVPLIVGGKHLKSNSTFTQSVPFDHKLQLCSFSQSNSQIINMAIDSALAAKPMWEAMPFNDRASIFLKAADLLSGKYRYEMMAATMLGQGKNVWQAEIDAAAELADFWRFNCKFAEEIYNEQPSENSPGLWNRVEYRALEGFVLAISPFNFTAIGGNLACAPALMGMSN